MELVTYVNVVAVGGVALFLAAIHTLRDAVEGSEGSDIAWHQVVARVVQYGTLGITLSALSAALQLLGISVSMAAVLLSVGVVGAVGLNTASYAAWARESVWLVLMIVTGLVLITYWPW